MLLTCRHHLCCFQVLVTSAAEAPAVLYASFAVDRLGRREAVASSLAATAASLVPVMFGVRGGGLTAALFFGRLFAMAAFTALYVLTPELYPTAIRTMGLGYNNALGRIGGLVAPFIAVDLVSRGQSQLAVGLLAGCCLAAAGAVMAVKRPPPSGQ